MRRPSALALSWLFATACSGGERPEMLCDLPAFRGRVRIEVRVDGLNRVLAGALTFDRATDTVVFRRSVEGAEVELRRDGSAGLRKTVDGVAAEVELADAGDLALLMSMLGSRPDPGDVVREVPGGYRIEAGGRQHEVRLDPEETDSR